MLSARTRTLRNSATLQELQLQSTADARPQLWDLYHDSRISENVAGAVFLTRSENEQGGRKDGQCSIFFGTDWPVVDRHRIAIGGAIGCSVGK